MSGGVHDMDGLEVVRGGAAPEELAAVLAVIAARMDQAERAEPDLDGYAAWRARRLAVLRRRGPWSEDLRHG